MRSQGVKQLLVGVANEAPLAPGSTIDALNPGQLGVFDAKTMLSIDGTTPVDEMIIVVGIDRDGDGTSEAFKFSAGNSIVTRTIKGYTFRPHTAGQPQVVQVRDYKANCDYTYGVKLEFLNEEILRTQSNIQFARTYTTGTLCCDKCENCPGGNVNELTKMLYEAFKIDQLDLVTTEIIATSAIVAGTVGTSATYADGDVMTEADLDATIVYNNDPNTAEADKVSTGIQITTNPIAIAKFCNVPLESYSPYGTRIITSLVAGFDCNGQVVETQELAYEEGDGGSVREIEYEVGGWYARPGIYRASNLGVAVGTFEYFAEANLKYDQFSIHHVQLSESGWRTYDNDLETIIAIPTTSPLASAGLVAILDGQIPPSFDNLADDVAAANPDITVVEPTEDKTPATDGIG